MEIIKRFFLLLFIIISVIDLESCTNHNRNIELTKLLAQKKNTSDTLGVRNLLADSVLNYLGNFKDKTFTAGFEINNILAFKIYGGFYQINEILKASKDSVSFSTKEHPGYILKSNLETDTLNYLMTYYFKNGRIVKIRTDTMQNMDYCYACIEEKQNIYLSDFFDWLNSKHPSIDSALNIYYSEMLAGNLQKPENVLLNEKLQKQYFRAWGKEVEQRAE